MSNQVLRMKISKPKKQETITILISLLTSFLVLLYIASDTSSFTTHEYALQKWLICSETVSPSGAKQLTPRAQVEDKGEGVRGNVVEQKSIILHTVADPNLLFSRLDFEIYLEKKPRGARIFLMYWPNQEQHPGTRTVDISNQIIAKQWQTISIDTDSHEGLAGAKTVGFVFTGAMKKGNHYVVRHTVASSLGLVERTGQLLSTLFTYRPMSIGDINFVPSWQMAGRGVTFIFWLALPVVFLIFCIRKYFSRKKFSIILHSSIACVVFVVLLDCRNSVDLFQNVQQAFSRKTEAKDFYDHLSLQEHGAFWFGDLVKYLNENIPADAAYYLRVNKKIDPYGTVAGRIAYYGRPAMRVLQMENADYAVLAQSPLGKNADWQQVATLHKHIKIYQRIDKK